MQSLKPSHSEQFRPEVTDEVLGRISNRIVEAFQPRKVILFGSYTYGKPHQDSDVDHLVVLDSADADDRPVQRSRRVRSIVGEPYLPMDIMVRTTEEIQRRLELGDFFIAEILSKGRVLYEHDAA